MGRPGLDPGTCELIEYPHVIVYEVHEDRVSRSYWSGGELRLLSQERADGGLGRLGAEGESARGAWIIMAQKSAGILMFRMKDDNPEVLLVHPGGPFWVKRDDGAWSIPKGLLEEGEDPLTAARREFEEETGSLPTGDFIALGTFKQPSGKIVSAWTVEGDFELNGFKSNLFTMEWPPKSGRMQEFPEADRAGWFAPNEAMRKLTKGQIPILVSLLERLRSDAA